MLASMCAQTDVVRELVAADGSAEHLQMKYKCGRTALDMTKNVEIKALLTAAEAAADAGAAASPPEGKAREGEEDQKKDSPPPSQTQGGTQPKKTLPCPPTNIDAVLAIARSKRDRISVLKYEGKANALITVVDHARHEGEKPDIAKVRELLDAGIDVRYQVRVSCVCAFVRDSMTRTSECMGVEIGYTTCTRCSDLSRSLSLSLSLSASHPHHSLPTFRSTIRMDQRTLVEIPL